MGPQVPAWDQVMAMARWLSAQGRLELPGDMSSLPGTASGARRNKHGSGPRLIPLVPVMAPFWRSSSMRTASRCALASPASS